MECETQPQLDPSLFEKNIAALREVDAALAERLAGLPLAPAEPAVGRDGSVTFRLPGPTGEPQWFGRTSMPTVSGPAMLDCFNHAGNNVALPGIGQGIEAKLLTDRLAAHRAVFVLEPDARRLALALRVHDLAAPLQSGKLVLLTGDDLAEQLGDFLAQSAGYVIPDRLLSWPWLVPGDIESFTAVLQQGSAAALHRRTAALADLERELAAAAGAGARTECAREGSTMQSGRTSPRGNPFPPPTTLVGLALHPSPSTARRAAELADAAAQAGLTWHHCIADAPAHGHALAHLHVVAKRNPERLLLGELPIGAWSTLMTLSTKSMPSISSCRPGVRRAR